MSKAKKRCQYNKKKGCGDYCGTHFNFFNKKASVLPEELSMQPVEGVEAMMREMIPRIFKHFENENFIDVVVDSTDETLVVKFNRKNKDDMIAALLKEVKLVKDAAPPLAPPLGRQLTDETKELFDEVDVDAAGKEMIKTPFECSSCSKLVKFDNRRKQQPWLEVKLCKVCYVASIE